MNLDLDSGILCRKEVACRSKYGKCATRRCHQLAGHPGSCHELPFLRELKQTHPKVAAKIERDSMMTTGAAWKSEQAGPNRILRWVMLLEDEQLRDYGIDMGAMQRQVVSKLRDKAAPYDACVEVAMWLTRLVYNMKGAPDLPDDIREYLQLFFGALPKENSTCVICRKPLRFMLFDEARRGKAAIETCHKDPRVHSAENVGFAHRECNIAQGAKSLNEFYEWIEEILRRAKPDRFA